MDIEKLSEKELSVIANDLLQDVVALRISLFKLKVGLTASAFFIVNQVIIYTPQN